MVAIPPHSEMHFSSIKAIEHHLPMLSLDNQQLSQRFPEWPAEKITEKLGISRRGIAGPGECSSDLAVQAALRLFDKQICRPKDIDFVLFCTQTPDYLLPTSACLIQDRLGIPKSSGAVDLNLGCSGYIYSLGIAKGLIESNQARNILLLTGETYSKLMREGDKQTRTLFGDAGAATLIGAVDTAEELIGPFIYGTDGSGAEHLIVRQGGMRQPGHPVAGTNGLEMNGGEIFAFSAREVSKAVNSLLAKTGKSVSDIDLFVFHQANTHMLNFLRKKCEIPEDKFYIHLSEVGNTVSNSIPIALQHAVDDGKAQLGSTVMLVGFGVGLSWAACLVRISSFAISHPCFGQH
jgi:3-oxoacyl-[acyl-carrier-protein] synthase-3